MLKTFKYALLIFLCVVLIVCVIFGFTELCSYLGTVFIGGREGEFIGSLVPLVLMVFVGCLFIAWSYNNKEIK